MWIVNINIINVKVDFLIEKKKELKGVKNVSENSLLYYKKSRKCFQKSAAAKKTVFINASLILDLNVSIDKECFSELLVTRKLLLSIYLFVVILNFTSLRYICLFIPVYVHYMCHVYWKKGLYFLIN